MFRCNTGFWSDWAAQRTLRTSASSTCWTTTPNSSSQDFCHTKLKLVPWQPGGEVVLDGLTLPDLVLHGGGGEEPARRALENALAAAAGGADKV